MRNEILNNIDNPKELEKLYRENKVSFKKEFNAIYPEMQHKNLQFWYERLHFGSEQQNSDGKKEIGIVVILALVAGLLVNIPNITGIDKEIFLTRNLSFIIFPVLIVYFIWKQKLEFKQWAGAFIAVVIAVFYMNLLPQNNASSSINLSLIHTPIFLWAVFGYAFLGEKNKNLEYRIKFLRYNGDLIIMSGILLLSTFLFSAITIGLFQLIDIQIEKFYTQYILIWLLAAIPIMANYFIQNNAQLINRVSPIIAKIFTPLVCINLFIYVLTMIITKKFPYQDRNLLLLFNVLLIGVMALILFTIAETASSPKSKFNLVMLFILSILTIIVNGIALYAISFRINEYGISPNRIAVLGSNLLIFINLLKVAYQLYSSIFKNEVVEAIEDSIARYLPIYGIWAGIVAFIIPILFQFK